MGFVSSGSLIAGLPLGAEAIAQTLPDGTPAHCDWSSVVKARKDFSTATFPRDAAQYQKTVEELQMGDRGVLRRAQAYASALVVGSTLYDALNNCSISGHSGTPRWQLHLEALQVWKFFSERFGVTGIGYTAQIGPHAYAILVDPNAPQSIRNKMHDFLLLDCIERMPSPEDARGYCESQIRNQIREAKQQRAQTRSPSAIPACSRQASVLNPVQPVYPDSASLHSVVTVEVLVDIGADGRIRGTSIYKSSGNPAIDAAALKAATMSTYSPSIDAKCHPAEGRFLFRADFTPD